MNQAAPRVRGGAAGLVGGIVFLASADWAWAQDSWSSERTALVVLSVVFGIAFFPVAAWFIFTGRRALEMAQASSRWPAVPGKVLESKVDERLRVSSFFSSGPQSQEESHKYFPVVRYEYEVAGTRYENNVIQFGLTHLHSSSAAELASRYPAGADVTVHYNPDDPKSAVLEASSKHAKYRFWGGVAAALLPFLIVAGLWLAFRYWAV